MSLHKKYLAQLAHLEELERRREETGEDYVLRESDDHLVMRVCELQERLEGRSWLSYDEFMELRALLTDTSDSQRADQTIPTINQPQPER